MTLLTDQIEVRQAILHLHDEGHSVRDIALLCLIQASIVKSHKYGGHGDLALGLRLLSADFKTLRSEVMSIIRFHTEAHAK
jgi:hypothetical protein